MRRRRRVRHERLQSRDARACARGCAGIIDCQIDLHGPDGDLHSGSFGGGVRNPLHVLADLLSGLHDAEGRVTLARLLRSGPAARTPASVNSSPGCRSTRPAWLAGPARSREAAGEAGFTTLERLWARPTAEINGMWGGYTGPGAKTIIPSDAHAKVSFRLVADQDPQEVRAAMESYVAVARAARHRGDASPSTGRACDRA